MGWDISNFLTFRLRQKYQLFFSLKPASLQTKSYPISSPDSQAFGLVLELHIDVPVSSLWTADLKTSQST